MFIYLNKYAGGGRAGRRWLDIESELKEYCSDRNYCISSDTANLQNEILKHYRNGERLFVAAGGDGTVNILLNEIMLLNREIQDNIIFGAIGLGSSNDFHKPFSKNSYISGEIPCKLDRQHAIRHNIGKVCYSDENCQEQTQYFSINCSLGIVAHANYLFNGHDRMIKMLKKTVTGGAIWYAGLKSLIKYKNTPCTISFDNTKIDTNLSNLGVLIKPNFSGNFRYDIEVDPQSDYLAVALCEDLKMRGRLNTISSLARGKFRGLPGTHIWQGHSIAIDSKSFMPLEFDGEVVMARDIKIILIKGGFNVCA